MPINTALSLHKKEFHILFYYQHQYLVFCNTQVFCMKYCILLSNALLHISFALNISNFLF